MARYRHFNKKWRDQTRCMDPLCAQNVALLTNTFPYYVLLVLSKVQW